MSHPWHDRSRPWDQPMPAQTQGREFYALITGYELKQFPNVPIVCKPLIDTSTHELALETNPPWVMKIRHVGCWRIKTRPKVRIYRQDMAGWRAAPAICFDLPSCHRFETIEAAFRAMEGVDFQLSGHNVNLAAVQRRTEEDIRNKLRAEVRREIEDKVRLETREETLNGLDITTMLSLDNDMTRSWLAEHRPKVRRKAKLLPSAEIISIRDRLAQRGLFLTDQEPSDLQAVG